MRLLIITQKVDEQDDNLGFFVRWIEEFAKHTEKVTVICLQKGKYRLPQNVSVLSLGKEEPASVWIIKTFRYIERFYVYVWKERDNYDAVFVHMNPIYILLGGVFWKLLSKKIALWYTHKQVDIKLRVAEKLADIVFTASKESFRWKSDKVHVVGHGIDTEKFKSQISNLKSDGVLKILSVSRITPAKNIHLMLEAAELLKKEGISFEMKIVGAPIREVDKAYFTRLKKEVQEKNLNDSVFFVGAVPYSDIPAFYQKSDLFINLSETGSLDKAVLEAMASGVSVLTSNEAFFAILPEKHLLRNTNTNYIVQKILEIKAASKDELRELQSLVIQNHSGVSVIKKMADLLKREK
ncbi:MAG: glycosyltransferase family 4 protein [Candidatus Lloydbacteria bacterium]|nr:glycosyltransferase family 4 protein [Candidatus Lloydbacteria bacterium]